MRASSRSRRDGPGRWLLVLGSVVLLAAPWARADEASVLEFPHNGPGLVAMVAPISVDFAELGARYANIRRVVGPGVPLRAVDARRLISRRDWDAALGRVPCEPWNGYGADALATWMDAVRRVSSQPPTRPVSGAFLREIHRWAMSGHYFKGYERRRIQAALGRGQITRAEHDALLARVERGERVYFSGADHARLPGAFRSDPLDSFVHNGESFLPDGRRYMIRDELDRLRSNRLFSVDETSLVEIRPGRFLGAVHYPAVHRIEEEVRNVLERAERALQRPVPPAEVVRAVVETGRDLMSIHPFIDGNGRTIRLLADFMLNVRGLPPPLYPNELDVMMTLDEAFHFTLRGMVDYVGRTEGVLLR